ncbi:MAG: hypothetical protein V7542_06995 [Limnobacter sp.]|uniref:hypothetical protein n=1 Tax=Limnobacter sp. TaxID=2003368 RepID=UPI003003754C
MASITLQPLINSITGISIKTNLPSIIGPVFFSIIIAYLLILLAAKLNIASLLTLIITTTAFSVHNINSNSDISDIPNYLKLILPFIIFLYIKNAKITINQFNKIRDFIQLSILIYAILVIISFLLRYQIQEGKGYFGLIYAGNDLIALFILFASMAYWNKFNYTKSLLVVLIAHILTLSKTILVYPLVFAAGQLPKSLVRSIGALILALGISYLFFERYLYIYISNFIPNLSTAFDLINQDFDDLARIVSFGRTSFLEDALIFINSDSFNWLFGVGANGAEKALFGKVGIEMDFYDALLMYGILGVAYLIIFYYSLPLLCKNINPLSKIIFLLAIAYSFLGGHFYNNPMVGFYYGLFMGLAYNRNLNQSTTTKQSIKLVLNKSNTLEK